MQLHQFGCGKTFFERRGEYIPTDRRLHSSPPRCFLDGQDNPDRLPHIARKSSEVMVFRLI